MDIPNLEELLGRPTIRSSNPEYKCKQCHDTGWIDIEDERGKWVKKCSCRLAREAEIRLERSGLADAVKEQTFDSFIVKTPVQRKLKETGRKYLENLLDAKKGDRIPWMYVGGNPGCGKTHICTAVCGELLKKNIGVRYMQWLDESRKLKAYVNEPDFDENLEQYFGVSVLYIDDLLKQKYTDSPLFTEADIKIAFSILNGRYLRNKPTIISSEWDLLDQLLPADEGVFSRVYERCKGFTVTVERKPENNFRLMSA